MEQDYLCLKWDTVKGWHLYSNAANEAFEKWASYGVSASAAMQHSDDDQKAALCDLIDAVNADTIENDWTGKEMTKEAAKAYVLEYGK